MIDNNLFYNSQEVKEKSFETGISSKRNIKDFDKNSIQVLILFLKLHLSIQLLVRWKRYKVSVITTTFALYKSNPSNHLVT